MKPELVFEIGFDGIQASTRHKSGIAVRFPRMLRLREDKRPPTPIRSPHSSGCCTHRREARYVRRHRITANIGRTLRHHAGPDLALVSILKSIRVYSSALST